MPSEVAEALAAANVTALIPKQIDPMLLEYQRRYSPLVYAFPTKEWGTNTYYFNQRNARGSGGFVTDGGARSVSNSTYVQNSFPIKLLQSIGAVTGFSQAITRDLIGDLKRMEIEGSSQSLIWDIETSMDWGNAAATNSGVAPQFDGMDTLISYFAASGSNPQNAIDKAGATLSMAVFDELIDLVETNVSQDIQNNTYGFILSSTANSKVSQILLANQRYVDKVEIAPGLIVPTYRNVPLIKSSFLSARTYQMGVVGTATATTGGTLAAATYFYQVAAIVARQGEITASAEVSQATTGSTSTVTLSFSSPTGLDGAAPILYKVYRSTTTGTEILVGIVDAYDTTGAAVTSIIDTGSNLLTNSSGNTGPSAYVLPTGGGTGHYPRAAGQEDIYCVPFTADFMVRPFVRDMTVLPLAATVTQPDVLPYAIVTDTSLALRAPKYASRARRVSVTL